MWCTSLLHASRQMESATIPGVSSRGGCKPGGVDIEKVV